MRPLRILLGAHTDPPDVNGAARFAERLGSGLARRGHESCPRPPLRTAPPAVRSTTG
jgi:phosphatidylinositol alpha 1,6-mannosyltransferase